MRLALIDEPAKTERLPRWDGIGGDGRLLMIAKRLGLHQYNEAFPIYFSPSNVDQLIAELISITNVLVAENGRMSGMDKLLAFLDRIKHRKV